MTPSRKGASQHSPLPKATERRPIPSQLRGGAPETAFNALMHTPINPRQGQRQTGKAPLNAFQGAHGSDDEKMSLSYRGEEIDLYGTDGKKFRDAMSSLWCCTLGYSEQRLVDAAQRQLRRLPYRHTFRGRAHDTLIELAETLVSIAPDGLSKTFSPGRVRKRTSPQASSPDAITSSAASRKCEKYWRGAPGNTARRTSPRGCPATRPCTSTSTLRSQKSSISTVRIST